MKQYFIASLAASRQRSHAHHDFKKFGDVNRGGRPRAWEWNSGLRLRRWVVHKTDDEGRVGATGSHVQGFVKLFAVVRQFESAAHFFSARGLFVGDEPGAVPMGGDLLI